jgi:hypothetical protein
MKKFLLKHLILFVVFNVCLFPLIGQTISYAYDSKGNLVRKYITLKAAHATKADTLQGYEAWEREAFEEKIGPTILRIYPNPTHATITVEAGNIEEALNAQVKITYQLFDIGGRVLQTSMTDTPLFTVDLSGYKSGTYLLRLNVNGKVSEWRVMKQ